MEETRMVIGSWGSYNANNERALGSSWITLDRYLDWDDIEAELEKQGFELDGIDSELFVQAFDSPLDIMVDNNTSPKYLFELLNDAQVFDDEYRMEMANAYIEVEGQDAWFALLEFTDECWSDEIRLYKGADWEAYGKEKCYEGLTKQEIAVLESMQYYIDWEAYGKDSNNGEAHEYSNGIIEIYW